VDRCAFLFLTFPFDTKFTVVSYAPFSQFGLAASFLFHRAIILKIGNKCGCIVSDLIGSINPWYTAISSFALNSIPGK